MYSSGGCIRWLGSPRPALPAQFDHFGAEVQAAIDAGIFAQQPCVFSGNVGVGKTAAMAAIETAIRAKDRHRGHWRLYHPWLDEPTFWTEAADYCDDVKSGFEHAKHYKDFTDDYSADGVAKRVARLFIDDLGVERGTDFNLDAVSSLIRERYVRGLPTWATTNLTLKELQIRYGERTISRLFERAMFIVITGPDRRLVKAQAV